MHLHQCVANVSLRAADVELERVSDAHHDGRRAVKVKRSIDGVDKRFGFERLAVDAEHIAAHFEHREPIVFEMQSNGAVLQAQLVRDRVKHHLHMIDRNDVRRFQRRPPLHNCRSVQARRQDARTHTQSTVLTAAWQLSFEKRAEKS